MRVTRMMTVGLILFMGGLFAQESGDIPFTQADANGKLQKKSLPDDASAFRLSLGLGGAALLDVGTTAGTVAAGDDARLNNNIKSNVSEQTIQVAGSPAKLTLKSPDNNVTLTMRTANSGSIVSLLNQFETGGFLSTSQIGVMRGYGLLRTALGIGEIVTSDNFGGSVLNILLPTPVAGTATETLATREWVAENAVNHFKTVADDTARFALTTSDVKESDYVYVESTQMYYVVLDDAELDNEDGYGVIPRDGVSKIQFRRGTQAELDVVTLADGEPGWTTDTKQFYMGDGTTTGGIKISPEFGTTAGTVTEGNDARVVNALRGDVASNEISIPWGEDGIFRMYMPSMSIGGDLSLDFFLDYDSMMSSGFAIRSSLSDEIPDVWFTLEGIKLNGMLMQALFRFPDREMADDYGEGVYPIYPSQSGSTFITYQGSHGYRAFDVTGAGSLDFGVLYPQNFPGEQKSRNHLIIDLNISAGASPYTYNVILPKSGSINPLAGQTREVVINMPASTNPTIKVYHLNTSGAALYEVTGTGSAFLTTCRFVYNGTVWKLIGVY